MTITAMQYRPLLRAYCRRRLMTVSSLETTTGSFLEYFCDGADAVASGVPQRRPIHTSAQDSSVSTTTTSSSSADRTVLRRSMDRTSLWNT
mmetsp:Transcript_16410/g.30483  ORF Transcript_16410/g.30483 Transcript_16410/m.30483 type:complete len:91 (+) Transcript_16410:418-690(+)